MSVGIFLRILQFLRIRHGFFRIPVNLGFDTESYSIGSLRFSSVTLDSTLWLINLTPLRFYDSVFPEISSRLSSESETLLLCPRVSQSLTVPGFPDLGLTYRRPWSQTTRKGKHPYT